MKAIRLQQCDQCQSGGQSKKCSACFGLKSFYFQNNNFFYWQKIISRTSILIRELRFVLDLMINAALIAGALFSLVMVYKILGRLEFDPRAVWLFIKTPSEENLRLLIFIFLNMYLYYRLALPSYKKSVASKNISNS
jgi:hypothetical protein